MEVNVLIGKKREELESWELELFLGVALKEDKATWKVYEKVTYPQLLKDVGIFKSTSEARRNGWEKDIPKGFADLTIGKLKNRITILNYGTV